MANKILSGIRSLILLSAVSANLNAGLVAPESLVHLQQSADLIIVGTTTAATQSSTVADLSIRVSRVIQGDETFVGSSIAAHWNSGHMNTTVREGTAPLNGSGIWFLQKASNGWRVLPVLQGAADFKDLFFPTSSGPLPNAYAYSEASSAVDKLASEIGTAIEADNGEGFQLLALHSGLLREMKSPVWGRLYQRMADSTSPERKVLGLSGLIRDGNGSALTAAAPIVASLGENRAQAMLLLSIRDYFRATDTDSVAAVGHAATDSKNNPAFREAAAYALAAIHNAASLPFLAALLDDTDQNLRIQGIRGIASFANGLAVQTSEGVPSLAHLQLPEKAPYKTADTVAHLALGPQGIARQEPYYLSFWKDWWNQNRASLGY
jgi:hypothetical protein